MRRGALALAAAAALAACNAPPPTFGELPDFSLTAVSSRGAARPLRRRDLLGRTWVAGFVFTRCAGPCPAISARMAALQKRLPPAAGLLSVTVDPDRDDPATLARYAERFGADPSRWLFVTGPKAGVQALLLSGFKLPAVEDPSAPSGQRVTHSTRLALLDSAARVRGYYDSDDEASVDALVRDAARLP